MENPNLRLLSISGRRVRGKGVGIRAVGRDKNRGGGGRLFETQKQLTVYHLN